MFEKSLCISQLLFSSQFQRLEVYPIWLGTGTPIALKQAPWKKTQVLLGSPLWRRIASFIALDWLLLTLSYSYNLLLTSEAKSLELLDKFSEEFFESFSTGNFTSFITGFWFFTSSLISSELFFMSLSSLTLGSVFTWALFSSFELPLSCFFSSTLGSVFLSDFKLSLSFDCFSSFIGGLVSFLLFTTATLELDKSILILSFGCCCWWTIATAIKSSPIFLSLK